MRLHYTLAVLSLVAALCACAVSQEERPDARSVHEPAPSKVADPPDPLAPFARLVGGEWQVTLTSGATGFHAWQWGPGKYSMRRMANSSNFVDNPWAGEVVYWHPGRKQVCLLSLHGDIPGIGRGVCEGTITFEGETEVGVFDLYQPPGLRKIGHHRTFDGPDKYHEILLEDTGTGLQPMNEWDFFRSRERSEAKPRASEEAPPKLSEHLKLFEALLGHTWEASGEIKGASTSAPPNAFHIQSTFEWVPSLELICARVMAPSSDGKPTHPPTQAPTHLLDAYFYHHLGADAVRCLALSNWGGRGGVYEGDLTVLDGGALQIDLKGYEGDQVMPLIVRLDFEADGTLRERVWFLDDAEPALMLDVRHKKVEPKKD